MELMLLRVFQRHVADQCRIVATSVPQINSAVAIADHDSLWVACQAFVVGAGNLSKALWGQRGSLTDQRKPLRDSLNVRDDSPLRQIDMRNNFEHYDERIDRWWRESPHHNCFDRSIAPPTAFAGLADIDMFRIYDSTSHSIVFWGQTFELQPVASEVARLLPIAQGEASRPHWEIRTPSPGT